MTEPNAASPVLRAENLAKRFGEVRAVDGVSLEVRRNEIVGLLGPNGAGKTTTINMILGVLEPSAGSIEVEGLSVARHRARALARTNFAAVYAPMPGNLTVEQALRFFGMVYGVRGLSARIDELIGQFDLSHLRRTKCGVLSSGEQTRAGLAKALLNRPRLLLLDEPTASLDPAVAQDTRAMIRRAVDETGAGVLWTSHNMLEVEGVCSRVMILANGRVRVEGDPKTLPAAHGKASLEDLFIEIARADAAAP